jgi:hypothetical protein
VAVLAVVVFHAAPALLPGGFAGVDVFFVISGFLITRILLDSAGRPGWLLGFYARRIRRIFPALLVVLAVTTVLAAAIVAGPDFELYLRHLIAACAFVPNLVLMAEVGYFDLAWSRPLLHLWSLGVEEQFYLVWPAIIAIGLRWKRPALTVAAVLLASFAWNLWIASHADEANFYSPLSRAWQLACGAALVFLPPGTFTGTGGRQAAAHALSLVGMLLLTLTFFRLAPVEGYPGWTAVAPVAGAALLIAAGPAAWVNRFALSLRPAVAIGLISYPLYLWHWPLIALSSLLNLDQSPWTWRFGAVALSFPAAWLTYRFVEQPARRGGAKTVALLIGGAALLAGAAALWLQAPNALRPAIEERRAFIAHYRHFASQPNQWGLNCSLGRRKVDRPEMPASCIGKGERGTWMVWGDSHAGALWIGLREARPAGVELTVLTGPACAPLGDDTPLCSATSRYGLDLVRRTRPDLVLLVQRARHEVRDWDAIAARIEAAGAKGVVVIGPVPQWEESLPGLLAVRFWPNPPNYITARVDQGPLATDRALRARAGSMRTPYISLIEDLCTPAGCRAAVPAGRGRAPIHSDYGHLTPPGARLVAREIVVPKLLALRSAGAAGAAKR